MVRAGEYLHYGYDIEVLYEHRLGDYIFVIAHVVGRKPHPTKNNEWLCECDTPWKACKVGPEEAVTFLLNEQFEVPDYLTDALHSRHQHQVEDGPAAPRPFTHWENKAILASDVGNYSDFELKDVLIRLKNAAILAVQELRKWEESNTGHRPTLVLEAFGFRLFDRFKVDPTKSWRNKKEIPPEFVDILGFRWPTAIIDIKNRIIPELRKLIEGPIAVIYTGNYPIGLAPSTLDEQRLARFQLVESLPKIERLVTELAILLDDWISGKCLTSAREEPNSKLRPPSDDELAAYELSIKHGFTRQRIKEYLCLTVDVGNISRMIDRARKWMEKGNLLPDSYSRLSAFPGRTITLDPSVIDLGADRDGRTPRQRKRKSS